MTVQCVGCGELVTEYRPDRAHNVDGCVNFHTFPIYYVYVVICLLLIHIFVRVSTLIRVLD